MEEIAGNGAGRNPPGLSMSTMQGFALKLLAFLKIALAAVVLLAGAAQARSNAPTEPGRVTIEINKSTQTMTVYVDGEKRYTWKVSTGRRGYATPSGSFRVLVMKEMHYSRKYDNAPMPFSIFFTSNGHAIHATNAIRHLGRVASHGCVRLSPRNAKTLYELVKAAGARNTTIRIVG
jgi:lipoprotein-anchoring transpeptidase ErfK/SrfK